MPRLVVHDHFNKHIAGEEFAFSRFALTVFHLHDFFGWHQDAAEFVFHTSARDAFADVALHGFLHA